MQFIENFYIKTVLYDLINKFNYKTSKKIPKIKKMVLNFSCKNNDIKYLSTSLLALELITNQKGKMTNTKKSNVLLKIRKGNPVGCKVTLRKKRLITFFSKLIVEIFPKLKNFDGFIINKKNNSYSYKLRDPFAFPELEEHYYLFNTLAALNITIVTNTETKEELKFILNSLKFPLKNSIYNSIGRV